MKPKAEYRLGIGASSILMILVVLSLAALSLLSLHIAKGNAALTQRNLDMTVAYYHAAADVQHTLAALDEVIAENYQLGQDVTAMQWTQAFQAKHSMRITQDKAFSFAVEAGAERSIAVEGLLTPGNVPRYTLTRHELTPSQAQTQQAPLTLFTP